MVPERHYCAPPLRRVDLDEVLEMIGDLRYFLLHAPRQSGKTSTLKALADHLNASGECICVYVNVQSAQSAGSDLGAVMQIVLSRIVAAARRMFGTQSLQALRDEVCQQEPPGSALEEMLELW